VLCRIFIDLGINGRILQFANHTNLFNCVGTTDDITCLRNDLCKLYYWLEEWLMLFNVDKCKVMHFGGNNTRALYLMNDTVLPTCTVERDLGVIIQDNLKVSDQCMDAANTANRILGMINRTFSYKSKPVINSLYTFLVCPHLDYCTQAGKPYLRNDIDSLEKVRCRLYSFTHCSGTQRYAIQ